MCNFLEGGEMWGKDTKLVYRHYATLYFVFCVDSSESELGILDLIHIFVETLDKSFENVCELDLIFHMDKVPCQHISLSFCVVLCCSNLCGRNQVHHLLDEIVMGGMVLETNLGSIIATIEEQNKIEKNESPIQQGFKDVLSNTSKKIWNK